MNDPILDGMTRSRLQHECSAGWAFASLIATVGVAAGRAGIKDEGGGIA